MRRTIATMSAAVIAGATTLVALQVIPGGSAGGQTPDPTVTLPDDSSTSPTSSTVEDPTTSTTVDDTTSTTDTTGTTETTGTTVPGETTTTTSGPTTTTIGAPGTPAPSTGLPQQTYLPLGVALKLADAAMADCAGRGFPVTVAVVDRAGVDILVARADGAAGATVDVAKGKAYAAAGFRTPTAVLAQNVASNPGLTAIPGFVILAGGQPISSAGNVVGAIGVSGAPSGDIDDACATAGLAAVANDIGPATAR
jgi:uncharacterized protein GlcG (DUF336 family)